MPDPYTSLSKVLTDWQVLQLAQTLEAVIQSPQAHGEVTLIITNGKVKYLRHTLSQDISEKFAK